jgi:hypothetical protein
VGLLKIYSFSVYIHNEDGTSKEYGSPIAETAVSNPAEGTAVSLLCLLCVVQVAESAPGLITRSGESYRLCVCVCVCKLVCALETSTERWPMTDLGCCATGKRVNRSYLTVSYGLFSVYMSSSRLKSAVLSHITFTQKRLTFHSFNIDNWQITQQQEKKIFQGLH